MPTGIERSGSAAASNAAAALGLLTVSFVAGLYTPPAEAELSWGSAYWNDTLTMAVCVCDTTSECAPCYAYS